MLDTQVLFYMMHNKVLFDKEVSTHNCIERILDAWKHGRSHTQQRRKNPTTDCYTLFYDIRGAYDNVCHDKLEQAMLRLKLPSAFVCLILDSLSAMTCQVRTNDGLAVQFDVDKGLRQGDPLSPLLFDIVLDPLHCALHDENSENKSLAIAAFVPVADLPQANAIWSERGVEVGDVDVNSVGLADDTTLLAVTMRGLVLMHGMSLCVLKFNRLQLCAPKTILVRRKAGSAKENSVAIREDDDIDNHCIHVEGVVGKYFNHICTICSY